MLTTRSASLLAATASSWLAALMLFSGCIANSQSDDAVSLPASVQTQIFERLTALAREGSYAGESIQFVCFGLVAKRVMSDPAEVVLQSVSLDGASAVPESDCQPGKSQVGIFESRTGMRALLVVIDSVQTIDRLEISVYGEWYETAGSSADYRCTVQQTAGEWRLGACTQLGVY